MIVINHAILHIFDFNSGAYVYGDHEVNHKAEYVYEFLQKHIQNSMERPDRRIGVFNATSRFKSLLAQVQRGEVEFRSLARTLGEMVYNQLVNSAEEGIVDVLLTEFTIEDTPHLGLFILKNKTAYTHQVNSESGSIANEITVHRAILPGLSQKIETLGIVNLDTLKITFVDKERLLDGEKTMVLPLKILECEGQISEKEAIQIVQKITTQVAENYGKDPALAVARAKKYINENAEFSETLSPQRLAREVFAGSAPMQESFEEKIGEIGLEQDIPIKKEFARRTSRQHKIKTDTGIEITLPSEYFENRDFVEFVNEPDGTISISIKNIGKILSK